MPSPQRQRVLKPAVDLGDEDPLYTRNLSRGPPDRRRVSLRWLCGSVLTGIFSVGLIGGALQAAIGLDQNFIVRPALAHETDLGDAGALAEKGRPFPAGSARARSPAASSRSRPSPGLDDRDIVRVRPLRACPHQSRRAGGGRYRGARPGLQSARHLLLRRGGGAGRGGGERFDLRRRGRRRGGDPGLGLSARRRRLRRGRGSSPRRRSRRWCARRRPSLPTASSRWPRFPMSIRPASTSTAPAPARSRRRSLAITEENVTPIEKTDDGLEDFSIEDKLLPVTEGAVLRTMLTGEGATIEEATQIQYALVANFSFDFRAGQTLRVGLAPDPETGCDPPGARQPLRRRSGTSRPWRFPTPAPMSRRPSRRSTRRCLRPRRRRSRPARGAVRCPASMPGSGARDSRSTCRSR